MSQSVRRSAYIFLCAFPFVGVGFVSVRPLRIAGIFQTLGVFLFIAVAIAAWLSGPRKVDLKGEGRWKQALAGLVLIAPSAIISLLWVGLGPPFQATTSENYMRFLVLVWNSILVTIGFVLTRDVLNDAGERVCSAIGLATALIAGAAYLICLNLSLAQTALALHGNRTQPPAIIVDFYSAIEFVACVMTYVTTAAFATAMGRVRLLGRTAAGAYVTVAAVLGLLIIVRGLAYPEISANTAPWYTRPGVIAGIPAIPWLMPYLLGAVLLRRTRAD
ncbi:hypothetical protein [Occallatibacter savannae]|uniref:hypothetical protein n=1 Tax=Occallatibacter savannae TaxID=1002691 RepID=UPI000D691CCC|nr:hypothetical protein [Occallatibacter savannae]